MCNKPYNPHHAEAESKAHERLCEIECQTGLCHCGLDTGDLLPTVCGHIVCQDCLILCWVCNEFICPGCVVRVDGTDCCGEGDCREELEKE